MSAHQVARTLRRLCLVLISVAACADSPHAPTDRPDRPDSGAPLLQIIAGELQQATSGRTDRGAQDEMLRIESRLPWFAGFHIDSTGGAVLHIKEPNEARAAQARDLLATTYAGRRTQVLGDVAAVFRSARVVPARYSVSELVGIEQAALFASPTLPGVQGAGA